MGLRELARDLRAGREAGKERRNAEQIARAFSEMSEPFKPTPEVQFGVDLAQKIRSRIFMAFDSDDPRLVRGGFPSNISQDKQYSVDDIAEYMVTEHFKDGWKKGLNYGYITEDQGLILPPSGKADIIYLIDPVDGSRMINRGAENGTVSMVAVPGNIENPTFADIQFAVTAPIKNEYAMTFYTKRVEGTEQVFQSAYVPLDGVKIPVISPMSESGHLNFNLADASLINEMYSVSPQIGAPCHGPRVSSDGDRPALWRSPSGFAE